MNDLRERLLNAENAVGLGVSSDAVSASILPAVRRRRALRASALGAVTAIAAIGITTAGIAAVRHEQPIAPAVPQVDTPSTSNAPLVTSASVGTTPGAAPTEQMWNEIDDRWVLALWAPNPGAPSGLGMNDYALVVVAPDGRTWKVADVNTFNRAQLLAWDPVARTALLSADEGSASGLADDQLGIVSLAGGENSWTSECLESDGLSGPGVTQFAAAYGGGYAVRNVCGAEFEMWASGGRLSLDDAGKAALADAEYPRAGIAGITYSSHGAMVGNTDYFFDPKACSVLVRPRAMALGHNDAVTACALDDGFGFGDSEHGVILKSMPVSEGNPAIDSLCGTTAVYGTLSDGSIGVGVIDGSFAKPMVLGGSRVSSCVDGRLTWYVAGGDLFLAVNDEDIARLVDLTDGGADATAGAGVVSVAPAPKPGSLG